MDKWNFFIIFNWQDFFTEGRNLQSIFIDYPDSLYVLGSILINCEGENSHSSCHSWSAFTLSLRLRIQVSSSQINSCSLKILPKLNWIYSKSFINSLTENFFRSSGPLGNYTAEKYEGRKISEASLLFEVSVWKYCITISLFRC